ncbi:MAG: succinate dehydrogenase assembly factor 2 [Anaerolineales bacterium]
MTRRARLKWHCRRGMRELDLLLDEFLETEYEGLSTADRDRFERLLECRNEDLMDWLMEGASPPDEELAGIVSRIREWRAPDV